MRRPIGVRRNGATEAIESNLFVCVVILENLSHISDGLEILIPLRIEVVQGGRRGRVSIGQSEVNGNRQINCAASENIFEE